MKFYDSFYSKYTQLVLSTDVGWIWFIHVGDGLVSIGVVSNDKSFQKEDFLPALQRNSYMKDALENAIQCDFL